MSTGEVDTTVAEEFDLTLSGPMTVTLPKGLKVSGTSSENLLTITKVDGRDEITYMLPHGELDDDLELRFEIGGPTSGGKSGFTPPPSSSSSV